MDTKQEAHSLAGESKLVVYSALAGNAAIAVIKFGASAWTGSSAMMAEAIHSVVDTGNQLLLLLGISRSKRKPTEEHPFGYGLQLYFWAFVVAILIFGLGAGFSAYEGIQKLIRPHPVTNAWVNYLVLGIAIVIEGTVWVYAFRKFRATAGRGNLLREIRRSKDPMVFTVLFEDSAAMLGLVTALAGIALTQWLDMPVFDGIASLVIALILAATAAFLAYECQSLLTGEAASPEVRRSIREIASAKSEVRKINEMLTMHFGPREILVAISLEFDEQIGAGDVARTVSAIEAEIKERHPEVRRAFVEAQRSSDHRSAQWQGDATE